MLVILGLLVGGVLSGQSLIRAAELRSVTSDTSRYQAAIYTFRDKYFALPGDMTNATAFWGIRAGTGSDVTCHQTIATTTGTCNGNGDGQIDYIAGDATYGERFLAWQHLARAGLIEGSYTGASGNASAELRVTGVNMPRSKLTNARFHFYYAGGPQTGHPQFFDGAYSHNTISFTSTSGYPLKPEEAWNVDIKQDDGKPATGSVFSYKNTSTWVPNCATTDVVSTATYALSNPGLICDIAIRLN